MNLKKKLRLKALNWATKNLLKALNPEELLILRKDGLYQGSQRLSPEQRRNLNSDAETIEHTDLWRYMTNEVKYKAQEKMFAKSENYEDMYFGKAMLYNIQILEDMIKAVK